MTRLSVNINKIATLRNARGGMLPSVLEAAEKCQEFGADGITVHPRPDERHITQQDARDLRDIVYKEYNIEGNPSPFFMEMVISIKPEQVTLVPDAENAITSNAGWDTKTHQSFLKEVVSEFKKHDIRTSIFLDPNVNMVESAFETGTDRIELYTEAYAESFRKNPSQGIQAYKETGLRATEYGLGVNAGHDLSLENIGYFIQEMPFVDEVSIGHALISEALYLGLENTIQLYQSKLKSS